jgi:NitT/TauT family transport system ATP-binding protein
MAYPSDPAGVEFNELKRELGLLVMEEQERHTREEMKME